MENRSNAQERKTTVRKKVVSDPYIDPRVSMKLDTPLELTDTKEGWKQQAMMHLEDYNRAEANAKRKETEARYYEVLAKRRNQKIRALKAEVERYRYAYLQANAKLEELTERKEETEGRKPTLKEAVGHSHISQKVMSKLTGIDSGELERYINGEEKCPNYYKDELASILGYGTDDLEWA